jgi:hypothetical protein
MRPMGTSAHRGRTLARIMEASRAAVVFSLVRAASQRAAPPVGTARLLQGVQAHLTDALHPHLTYLLEELW